MLTRPLIAWLTLTGIGVLKLLVFIILAVAGTVRPFVGDNAKDHYLPTAERLVSEGRFNDADSRPDSKVGPGYPALLALAKGCCGQHYLYLICCVQIVVDTVIACCLLTLGARFFSPVTGILSAIVWSLYPPAWAIATWITAENVFTGLLIVSITLLAFSLPNNRLGLALSGGVTLGLASLFRGTPILLPLLVVPCLLRNTSRARILVTACWSVGFLAVVVPWFVRNIVVLDDPIVTHVGIGSAFLQGSDEGYFTISGKKQRYPALFLAAEAEGVRKPLDNRESGIDRWMFKVGLRNYQLRFHERPMSIVPFEANKFVRLWFSTESGGMKTQFALGILSAVFLPFACAGFYLTWNKNRQLAAMLLAVVAYFVILHVITVSIYRYVFPVFPFLVLSACFSWVMCFPESLRIAEARKQQASLGCRG
jgi:4-amino-4-deoxy-L-arabinose transferase-like glycosyltransferase